MWWEPCGELAQGFTSRTSLLGNSRFRLQCLMRAKQGMENTCDQVTTGEDSNEQVSNLLSTRKGSFDIVLRRNLVIAGQVVQG